MALDDTVPADGDGITTGVKVSELAGHIRDLKTDLNNDFATLEYVNASLAANTLNLFLTDTSSAEVGGYYEMLFSETGSGGSSLTENSVSDGETLLWSYVSPQFAIADQISAGLYIVSIWVEQDSNKTVTFTAKLYKRDSGGTETELVETSTSDTVTKDTKTQIIMSGFLENDTPISSTDRVVLKIYSNVSGGGGAPDITIYMEGTDDSRAAVRIPTSVITKKIFDADGDTYITVEETADEDKIHVYTAGTKRLTIDENGYTKIITPARCQVYSDSNWSIANNAVSTLSFNSELTDPSNMHSTTTNTSRIILPTDGDYLCIINLKWASNATGARRGIIRLNGTTNLWDDVRDGATGVLGVYAYSFSFLAVGLSKNDYLELRVYQNSGAGLTLYGNANSTLFTVTKII